MMVRARQPAQGKTVQMGCIPFEQSFLLTSAQRATDKHISHLLHGDVHFHVRPDIIGKKSLISMCVCDNATPPTTFAKCVQCLCRRIQFHDRVASALLHCLTTSSNPHTCNHQISLRAFELGLRNTCSYVLEVHLAPHRSIGFSTSPLGFPQIH